MALPLILIVDDNPENLTVLGELLQPEYSVRVANSGVRALRLARLKPQPGLILLDVMMPEMDGYEVLGQLRAQPETAGIPVVFLTAQNDPANAQRALLQGAAAYLTKPVVPGLLLDLVRQQLQATETGASLAPRRPQLLRIGRRAAAMARQLRQPPALPLPPGLQADAPLAALSLLASQVVSHLQEHWDGSGYPAGLAGDAIPLTARLWAVADACERLASAGPDQPALPPGRWLPALLAERGHRYDPAAIDALVDSLALPLALADRPDAAATSPDRHG